MLTIALDLHAGICVIGDHCLIVHDHNRPANVFEYNPKAESQHAAIVNTLIAYTQPETCQVVTLLINQAIEMKSIEHHLFCQMQCYMNGVSINEVPKFLAPISSETTCAIHIKNSFDATHPLIIPLKSNEVTNNFEPT